MVSATVDFDPQNHPDVETIRIGDFSECESDVESNAANEQIRANAHPG